MSPVNDSEILCEDPNRNNNQVIIMLYKGEESILFSKIIKKKQIVQNCHF